MTQWVLAVRLSKLNDTQGAIRVERMEARSTHRSPPVTEVPGGRDILLTAIGGEGEADQVEGDGQWGIDGVDGTYTTRPSDATNGTDGGRGGGAGRGTNGGNGGNGGTIDIILNEDSTHLLMAVSTDVRGGPGDVAGRHGRPGSWWERGQERNGVQKGRACRVQGVLYGQLHQDGRVRFQLNGIDSCGLTSQCRR